MTDGISSFDTFYALQHNTWTDGDPIICLVKGYYDPDDGGGGILYLDASSVVPNVDNGFFFNDASNNIWARLDRTVANARQFGAYGDAVFADDGSWTGHDDFVTLRSWLAAGIAYGVPCYLPEGSYAVSRQLTQPTPTSTGPVIVSDLMIHGDGPQSIIRTVIAHTSPRATPVTVKVGTGAPVSTSVLAFPDGAVFQFSGQIPPHIPSGTGQLLYLTAPANAGDLAITLNAASYATTSGGTLALAVDDYILLMDTSQNVYTPDSTYPGNIVCHVGMPNRIKAIAVDGTTGAATLTLYSMLEFSLAAYDTGSGLGTLIRPYAGATPASAAATDKLTGPIRNITIRDLAINLDAPILPPDLRLAA